MRADKGKDLYRYNFNPDFLNLLARYKNENQQVKFILEAVGYNNLEDTLDETYEEKEETGKVKNYFKNIFRKVR